MFPDFPWVGTSAQVSSSDKYDLAGDLVQTTDFDNQTINYVYDALGRETGENWMSGNTAVRLMSFAYDLEGNLLTASDVDPNGANLSPAYNFTYDGSGNVLLTTVSHLPGLSSSENVTLSNIWDYNDNLVSLTAMVDNATDFIDAYQYDAAGQMTSVTQTGVDGGDPVADKEADFTYTADGQLHTINRYDTFATPRQTTAESVYTYNDDGNLTGLVDTDASGGALASYVWQYDAAGQVTDQYSLADAASGATSSYTTWAQAHYNYDPDGQLTNTTSGGTTTYAVTYTNWAHAPTLDGGTTTAESYSFDANGNRNTGQAPSDNEVTFDGTYTYSYDPNGNRTARWVDKNGVAESSPQPGDTDITIYTWDFRNRLTSVTHYAYFADIGLDEPDSQVEYTYDVFNRLVSEQQTVGGTLDEDYVYDGANLELVLSAASGSNNGAVTERELWGPGVNQILASESVQASSTTVSWMLTDNEGTVRDVVQYTLSGQTQVVDHLVYGAFGAISSQTPAAATPRFTYTAGAVSTPPPACITTPPAGTTLPPAASPAKTRTASPRGTRT